MKCIVDDKGRYGFNFVDLNRYTKQISILSIDTKTKWLDHDISPTWESNKVPQFDIIFYCDAKPISTVTLIAESSEDFKILKRHTAVISQRYGLHLAFFHIPKLKNFESVMSLYDTWNGKRYACRYPRKKKGVR